MDSALHRQGNVAPSKTLGIDAVVNYTSSSCADALGLGLGHVISQMSPFLESARYLPSYRLVGLPSLIPTHSPDRILELTRDLVGLFACQAERRREA